MPLQIVAHKRQTAQVWLSFSTAIAMLMVNMAVCSLKAPPIAENAEEAEKASQKRKLRAEKRRRKREVVKRREIERKASKVEAEKMLQIQKSAQAAIQREATKASQARAQLRKDAVASSADVITRILAIVQTKSQTKPAMACSHSRSSAYEPKLMLESEPQVCQLVTLGFYGCSGPRSDFSRAGREEFFAVSHSV